MSHLIQILLPVYDNEQKPFPASFHTQVKIELKNQFGGLTAYNRAPAEGLWEDKGRSVKDEIVVYEVMAKKLDPEWWASYRQGLEKLFQQQEILIRALSIQAL